MYGITTADEQNINPIQYAGRENDGINCLYFNRARYYSPCLGRFISWDPLGLAAGVNTYSYVHGNPVSFIDPSGQDWKQNLLTVACVIGLCNSVPGGINPNLPNVEPTANQPASNNASSGSINPKPTAAADAFPPDPAPEVPIGEPPVASPAASAGDVAVDVGQSIIPRIIGGLVLMAIPTNMNQDPCLTQITNCPPCP